jgi:hypothetical protein
MLRLAVLCEMARGILELSDRDFCKMLPSSFVTGNVTQAGLGAFNQLEGLLNGT